MEKRMFKEVRNGFYDEIQGCYCIDAWRTGSQSEEGVIVAKVYSKDRVEYTRPNYESLEEVKEAVEEAKSFFDK